MVETDSFVYAGDHQELLQSVAEGNFADLTTLITRRIPLEDLVDKGIMALIHEKHEHGLFISLCPHTLADGEVIVKILVHP